MRPKKHLGQNFLINRNIVKKIVESANIKDKVVFEIGPGKGALSFLISEEAKHLYAFEIDKRMEAFLEPLDGYYNAEVIYEDVLNIDLNEFIEEKELEEVSLVANIPYYITGLLLNKVKDTPKITEATIMMQKEVGERLTASIGTRQYGSLTVIFNFFYDIKRVLNVKRNNFAPMPKVDSVVLKFTRKEDVLKEIKNIDFFIEFVEASFKMKRKTLVNNLASHFKLKKNYIVEKLQSIDPHFKELERAENITVKRFINFTNRW